MAYNLTLLQEAETGSDILTAANTYSGDIFVTLIIVAVFFIMLLALKRYGFLEALLASSFVSFLLSIPAAFAYWVHWSVPLAFLAVLAFGTFYLWVTTR